MYYIWLVNKGLINEKFKTIISDSCNTYLCIYWPRDVQTTYYRLLFTTAFNATFNGILCL